MSDVGLRMMGKDPEGDARGVEVTDQGAVKTQVTGSIAAHKTESNNRSSFDSGQVVSKWFQNKIIEFNYLVFAVQNSEDFRIRVYFDYKSSSENAYFRFYRADRTVVGSISFADLLNSQGIIGSHGILDVYKDGSNSIVKFNPSALGRVKNLRIEIENTSETDTEFGFSACYRVLEEVTS